LAKTDISELLFTEFVACCLVKQVVPSSWSRLRNGILTFHTTTSCHPWRPESAERSCWWWPRR